MDHYVTWKLNSEPQEDIDSSLVEVNKTHESEDIKW